MTASLDVRSRSRPDPSSVRVDGPWAHRDLYANGIKLHLAEVGEGPMVVLLHGFAGFWWTWRHQLTALGDAGYRVVAPDLRGYGDSDKPPRGYDAWTLAGDVGGLIKSLGERKAHLVGHGWGGQLAWAVAGLHPRLVHSVSAIAAPHPLALRARIGRSMFHRRAGNQARAMGRLFGAQLPMLPERRLTRDGAAAVEERLRAYGGPQWTESADFADVATRFREAMLVQGVAHSALEYYRWAVRSQIRTEGRRFAEVMSRPLELPTLRLRGELDPVILDETVLASKSWLPSYAPYRTLTGAGHYPHLETPAAVNRELIEFLRESRAQTR
ncbi:pimeloyl-ACP methyl ester carboxylesterase [Herbihabitans rhizosphaerae]|uniref:Pimeloyl-ACP methyl ester carboxylesterase n=1 Tax=Herbihabitans rhizosphaerae TaxID=1872711 RepID=A0A4Q7KYY5_9PSEU|nr:alpha/beta hydrolase [Herbihabitans rhizosphaerae]RZS41281.1 pimeloyl-ACP methyl ester carboxylesterase [Herbihabitans rhizosphaerae]